MTRTSTDTANESVQTSADRKDERAQSSIDFLVGMSVFLLTVAFVVAFLPSVFEPFNANDDGDALAADRNAALLAEHLLVDPAKPTALNATCTSEFFSEVNHGIVDDCRFSTDASALDVALGLGPRTAIHVTIEENGAPIQIYENGTVDPKGDISLEAGPTPPHSESVVTARRVVLLDGEERDLFVRVW